MIKRGYPKLELIIHSLIKIGKLNFNERALRENLRFMAKGGFSNMLSNESIGGNAGKNHLAVNFAFDKNTGQIVYLGNDGVEYEKKGFKRGAFLYFIDFKTRDSFIDDIVVRDKSIPKDVLKTLAYSAYQWNMKNASYGSETKLI